MPYIFGPVPSRRLGLSLGVDLIPAKTCTYDCLYCQVGRTTSRIVETRPFAPIQEVLVELKRGIEKTKPDTITLAGSGEPTLHSEIDQVIEFVRGVTGTKIAVLTNGSLLWREDVRRRISAAHIIMPTFSTVFEETFQAIHRSHRELNLSMIVEGLKSLRRDFRGLLFLEVIFLAGFNDSDREIEGLKRVIGQIGPDRIQLNTVVRPPADSRAVALGNKRLTEIKDFLGEKAEIIAGAPLPKKDGMEPSLDTALLEMAKRRPVRATDISQVLSLSPEEVEAVVKGLLSKGVLGKEEHSGEVYYSVKAG